MLKRDCFFLHLGPTLLNAESVKLNLFAVLHERFCLLYVWSKRELKDTKMLNTIYEENLLFASLNDCNFFRYNLFPHSATLSIVPSCSLCPKVHVFAWLLTVNTMERTSEGRGLGDVYMSREPGDGTEIWVLICERNHRCIAAARHHTQTPSGCLSAEGEDLTPALHTAMLG